MYITGIGRTKFGILEKSLPELLYEAIYKALDDSPVEITDINAIIVANFLGGPSQGQLHLNSLISSLLPGTNLPVFRVEAACASGGLAVHQAFSMPKKFKNILVVGVEKLNNLPTKTVTKNLAMAGDVLRDQKEGVIFPAQYAIVADQYLRKYAATHDDLALVSLKNHRNATLNPLAHFHHKDVDLETINSSPMVCSPLNLFDCCPISDGSASLILSRTKKSDQDIKIIGSAFATDSISLSQRKELTNFKAAKLAAKTAYEMAKVRPKNIDIAEVHDCFTIAEIIAMEDLGFCNKGEGTKLVRNGDTSLSGKLPINTDGGLIGDGHPVGTTGIAQICEIVQQLRGEAGRRQVSNTKIGLTHNIGGVGGTAVVHILEGFK
ncbi:MAG: thiolase domain-containing protein [Candidatus Thermoplasmatota archaeon]|nr:thiolase domain-containing protein [Candidatus Thermoplasmatota archaeon]MBU4256266.1 thiolase domain-containing protein [Candidatus Thermoplasmatota archaeon]MCG2825210.1 thiolase domain-containing protein [Thermoplasmatales archaeon]